ncbi:bifunctional glycosyltransferase/CDP-glycerol:glycerophosphate glycerophosphotransferase [Mangrovihabitans endophyticus]|uniref:Glycosyl transferase n=1 Tax=Mangrovihabitans endophyticus TaxID=1751298 RepID=A0A8J3C221_9ACTN|nr:bifunctional glycosyltransferase family 2 protein/CDP-glycerol:glycerophosphate glycerophosphotransferase [Mangrovihabitans endophyticus]GGK98397.1 glycosyl transferase [Mangrovihabitans endophyticus]
MTAISIVLPVYKVQAYLRQCLDSLLGQSFTDFEVVAVDDCSPDYSGAILAEYAQRDSRVRVVTMPENVGLGRARNAGLDEAVGEYVWFLDSDDWMAHGALAAVANRLRATEADVLVVGFDRVHWDGRVVAGSAATVLPGAPETFTAQEWPRIVNVLHVAWNKIVRRDLLTKLGFRFEQGWYEDVSFTYPVLVAASRISGLPRTCVHYRQRRSGAITRTIDDRHFEIFDHWAHAFALIDEYSPDRAEALRPPLFRRMIWHYLMVLRNANRVPYRSRRRFFARMHDAYRQFAPPGGYDEPDGGQGVRHRLVGRGSYRRYRAFDLSTKLRTDARRTAKRAVRYGRRTLRRVEHGLLRLYYLAQLRRPVDPDLALFAAYWYRGVACNPAAVAAKAEELVPGMRRVWVVSRSRVRALPPGTDYVVAGTRQYYRAVARARWMVNNVNWPQWLRKRPGTMHVMTHHGTPLKKMGLDQLDHSAGRRSADLVAQMQRADRWDFSVTANAHTTVAWERAYPCGYRTLEVGYPRNDRLATAAPDESVRIRDELGLDQRMRVVLYAPTHRDWRAVDDPLLDVDHLAERLGPDTVLLVRAHYFHVPAGGLSSPPGHGRIVDVSAHPAVEDLYLAADLLITDYSSAMFDYAVLDRPVVIYAPDWPVYRELRGVYFDLMETPPGAVATTEGELIDILSSGAYASDAATSARTAFRARFCYLDDGGAAERVVRRVFLNETASDRSGK